MTLQDNAAGAAGAAVPAWTAETRFSDWLRDGAEPFWTAAAGHRFTRELADDSLPDAVYRRYLIQDYLFLDLLVRVVGHAIAAAPSLEARITLSRFLAAVTGEENTYFLRSFEALGVDQATLRTATPNAPTAAFEEIMLGAAQGGDYADVLSVLLPVEWVYLTWAQAVADQTPARFYLREWIALHAVPAFADFVGWLRAEMDREGAALPPHRQERLAASFRRIAEQEVAFFDAAYE